MGARAFDTPFYISAKYLLEFYNDTMQASSRGETAPGILSSSCRKSASYRRGRVYGYTEYTAKGYCISYEHDKYIERLPPLYTRTKVMPPAYNAHNVLSYVCTVAGAKDRCFRRLQRRQ